MRFAAVASMLPHVGIRATFELAIGIVTTMTRPTKVVLAGYVIYVPLSWIFGVAPGEIAFDGARTSAVPEPLDGVVDLVRIDDRKVAVALRSPEAEASDLAVVDLDRLAAGEVRGAVLAKAEGVGRPRNALVDKGRVRILTEDGQGIRREVAVEPGKGWTEVKELDASALWIVPEIEYAGHGLTDWLVDETFDVRIAATPAIVSGTRSLLRKAGSGGTQDEHGVWLEPPDPSPDDFVVLDAFSTEPLGFFDTLGLTYLGAWVGREGFVYLEGGFPMVAWCDGGACESDTLHVRTESRPIEVVDIRADVHRIAVCTPQELYLYEGDPPDEALVYLGRTDLLGPCVAIAVIDDHQVLVIGRETPPAIVEFLGEDS